MPDTVLVTLRLDPATAAALQDPATRARVERIIQRTARPANVGRLFAARDALAGDVRRRGLTDEIFEAEIAADNAEGRKRPPSA